MSHVSHRLLALAAASALGIAGCASHPKKPDEAAATPASGQAAAADQGGQTQPLPASTEAKGSDQGGGQAAAGGTAKAAAATPAPPPAAKPSLSAEDLATLEDELKHYPRVLWHSHDDTYQFYVGTVLFARYDPYKDVFTISTDNADHKDMVCTHDPGAGWKVDGQAKGTTCQNLLKQLSAYLSAE